MSISAAQEGLEENVRELSKLSTLVALKRSQRSIAAVFMVQTVTGVLITTCNEVQS